MFDGGNRVASTRYCGNTISSTTADVDSNIRKSAWQVLALPTAMETFAELSIFNEAPHSRLASFFALLANAALHLSRKQTGAEGWQWRTSGLQYARMAKLHLQHAFTTDLQSASSKTYKQMLMTLIALATAAMYHEPKSMSAFLIDAERLIRLRGIPNPKKSFGMRVLHHVYTHLRILDESFSQHTDEDPEDATSPPLTESSASSATDLRKFRISPESLNAGLDSSALKILDLGYNDIHLEIQGFWTGSLFLQIYGIPESLLTLLSQTICLANDEKRLERMAAANSILSAAVARHTKTLEARLWSRSLADVCATFCDPAGTYEDPCMKSFVAAMHQAILIYFYRRVTNVHAMLIQNLVQKVLESLQPCMMEAQDPDFVMTVAWPYLIAASEAATPELQQLALRCLNSIDALRVPFVLENATKVAQQVWQRREQTQDYTISWLDVAAK